MGSGSSNNFIYSTIYKKSQKEGESAIYRHPDCLQSLKSSPSPNILTIQDILKNSYKFGVKQCLGTKNNGIYYWRGYEESLNRSKGFASGLFELGIDPKKADNGENDVRFLAIYSKNREEVVLSDFACIFYGWISLPIYDTLGPEALDFIFDQTEVQILVCSLENLIKLIKDKRFGKLKTIITFEKVIDSNQLQILSDMNLKLYCFEEVLEAGKKKIYPIIENVTADSTFTFSYTSGTTGKPKGAMLTHGNLVSVVTNAVYALDLTENDVYLSYLPLAHILEKIIMIGMIYHGCSIGFYGGDVQKLKDDMVILKPTVFVTVPRLLLRLHDVIKSGIEKLKGCKKSLAGKAIIKKLRALQQKGTLKHTFYDRIIFKKMRLALGDRVRWLLVGSAPTSHEVLNFLKIAFCCNIMEGYGQTESTGASFVTRLLDNKSAGCVGGPCVNTEFKLVDVPEMNYTSKDLDEKGRPMPRGEMCIKGFGVFKGYYKDPEKTKETLDEEGWLHTGDVVQINRNGSIKIIDRKKNIFKLSHGEYVAAEKIESTYLQNKLITEIFVHGDSFQSYLIAIVVPNIATIKEFANKEGIPHKNIDDLLKTKEVKNYVLNEMNKTGKEAKLFGFEMVKNLYLEKESFALKDILTTTFKLKRHEAKKFYEKIFQQLYQENIGN